jgi:putative phage-type endonuclease
MGKVTASKVADVLAKVKSGEAASVKNYRAQLVVERLTGCKEETYTNAAMQRGIDLEASARECYEFISGNTVEQIAFIDHPTIPMSGASPDGLVGTDGLVEIKCPSTATHIEYLLGGIPPAQYLPQMLWQMACAGPDRKWCDFVSYDPRLPEEMQLFVARLHRDDTTIATMETEVVAFLKTVDDTIAKLRALRP